MDEERQPDWRPGEKLIVFGVLLYFTVVTLVSVTIISFINWGPR